eukprot:SAG22_NODE_1612_length_3998_cov_12.441652_5_plen_57_part_00
MAAAHLAGPVVVGHPGGRPDLRPAKLRRRLLHRVGSVSTALDWMSGRKAGKISAGR